ncbi:MAG: hypothetical protein HY011_28435 [Acidobacteria bacterium]|nr:hypothetical protein [Acidobacteriota bacterium]
MKRSRSSIQFGIFFYGLFNRRAWSVCLWLALVSTGVLAIAQTNVPTLTGLAPNSAQAGTPGLTITVSGLNFNRLTTVRWNGADRPTNFISTAQLTALITAADLAVAGTAQVTAFNPGAGGGASNPLIFTITQPAPPAPTLLSLNPNAANAGGPAFTLTLNGANFVNASVARWNGSNLPTNFLSATQLTAQVPASDIAAPGSASVTVFTPPNTAGVGGGTSSPVSFTINQAANPVPTLINLNPNQATAGGGAFTLTLTGANFINGSVARWNGSNRPTQFLSATQLSAQIPASDIANGGSASVTVFNPPNTAGAGGGTSNPVTFTINAAPTPTPTLISLNPNTANAGSPPLNLMLTGTNFGVFSVVRWNGANRPTTFLSASQLSAQIPASDLANAGSASVTVFNTDPNGAGGLSSNALPFTINQAPAPVPTLTSLNPNTANAGSAGFTLMLSGTNFSNTSVARWNGADRPTTFVSATQLMAQIPATDIANAGTASVAVFNPPNAGGGGGTTNALPFTIIQAQNPVPTLINATPNPIQVGTPGVTLLVTGANFVAGSVLRWNGANRQTTFISSTQLSVLIPATDLDAAGTASIVVFNPAPGGGQSNALTININNPAPIVISITPNAAVAGSPAFALTVNGSGFIAGSVVRWNGQNRTTQFINATQLGAQIPATDIANAGVANVTVFNPPNTNGSGGGSSNPVPFTINVAPNPVPRLTALNPSAANAGSAGFTLTVTGANFINSSVLRWNGTDRPTTFLSATQLMAQIPPTDIANTGTATVAVFNPPNASGGGGTSNSLPFTINQAPAPVPTLTSLTPNAVNAGGAGFALMLTGTNFINTSVVHWNGANRPTTIVSATQLMAQIPATDIASAGTAAVTVLNPPNVAGAGGGTSNALTFTINQQQNPVPTLTAATPNPLAAGAQGVTLLVTGTNFVANSVLRWNGANRPTMFVSATQLSAQIPASDLLNAGTASIAVFNPAPGGGQSNALTINVNNPAPVIAAIIPNSIVAGSGEFTLTINGNGFLPASVVRWNGANRTARFVGGTQLAVQVPAADVANTGTAQITVFNPVPGGGTSNAAVFTITPRPLPPPTLNTVTASAVAQGARQVRLTLIGANFRPGARVVIGPSESNAGLMPAADILVESVNRVNETMIYAVVSVANNATLNMRAVDVVNADLTSTGANGSRTTKPLRVQGGSSLGAPLQITSVLIIYPRNGTVISQGERLIAEAVLAGAGTGTVIGQWLWDGNVTEQFALNFTAGERRTLRPNNPLPTIYLGPHRLEIKITSPNMIQSPPVEIIINNGTWKMLRLLEPNSGAGYVAEQTPVLRWTPVPGAMKYQIGFSTQPFFNTITQWHDVTGTEWQVPLAVWQALPEGELWWTARVVETAGNLREPAAMRRINRLTPGALKPVALTSPTDTTILEWQPVRAAVIYRVTITSDVAGKLVIKRFATANAKLDVKKLSDKFQPGVLYYWRVEAFNLKGRLLMTSERYNFLPKPQKTSSLLPVEKLDWQIAWPEVAAGMAGRRDSTVSGSDGVSAELALLAKPQTRFGSPERAQFNSRGHGPRNSACDPPTLKGSQTDSNATPSGSGTELPCPGALPPAIEFVPFRDTAAHDLNRSIESSQAETPVTFVPVSAMAELQADVAEVDTPSPAAASPIYGAHGWAIGKEKDDAVAVAQTKTPASTTVAPKQQPAQKTATEPQNQPAQKTTTAPPNQAEPPAPQTQTAPPPSPKLTAMIAARSPLPDAFVKTATPAVSIDFNAPIQPSEVGLQIDDTDYSALAKITDRQVAFQPTIPLTNGKHQLLLNVGEEALGWFFTVNAAATTEQADPETKGTDAEQTTTATGAANAEATAAAEAAAAQQAPDGAAPVPAVEKEFKWEAASNQQDISGSEQDTHNLSLSMQGRYKNGPWLTEMNGSGLLNSLLSPNPRHSLGRFNDYIFHFGREWPFGAAANPAQPNPAAGQPGQTGLTGPQWGIDLRFGMVSPQSFLNAEYVSTGFAREGVELALKTPGGTFGFYRNTNDKGQGEGIGFGFHQRVYGGSYDAPAFTKDPERVKFRLMWLSANDVGGHPLKIGYDVEGNPLTQIDAFATPRVGDSYGSLLAVKLNKDWNWVSEYAITSNNVNRLAAEARRQFGRAWRTGFVGTWHKANISFSFRDVSPNYSIPATASLTQLSASDRRGVDFAISRNTLYGTFSGQYQYLQSDFRYDNRAHVGLNNVNLNWAKQLTHKTVKDATFSTMLSVGANVARTTTSNRTQPGIIGLADQGRDGVNVNLTETLQKPKLGALAVTVGGSRNWFRDTVNQRANNILTSLNVSTNWTPVNPWFQWTSTVSVNWLAGERFSVGASRTLTAYIQPTFNWTRTGLSLTPLVTLNQLSSQMLQLLEGAPLRRLTTGDMWMTNHGARLAWQLPGKYRFNVLSFEGSQMWMRDGLSGMTHRTPRLLFLWTIVQPAKPAPPKEEKQPQPEAQPQQSAPPSQTAPVKN